MKHDHFNVNSRFWWAQAFLNMDLKDDARSNVLIAIRFDPNNEELRKELRKEEEMCNTSCEIEVICDNFSESFYQGSGKLLLIPWNGLFLPPKKKQKKASSLSNKAKLKSGNPRNYDGKVMFVSAQEGEMKDWESKI